MPTMDIESLRIPRRAASEPAVHKVRPAAVKAVFPTLLGSAVLGIAIAGLAYSHSRAIPLVETETVQPAQDQYASAASFTASGYIVAAHKIQVASKVIGRVQWIGVEPGDKVKQGQILVRLEDEEYRAQEQEAQGQLESMEASLKELEHGSRPAEIARSRGDLESMNAELANARSSLNRMQALYNAGVLAKQALDDAQARYDGDLGKVSSLRNALDLVEQGARAEEIDSLRGKVMQAKGALNYAQAQLDNTVIRAPVDGTILDRNVQRGEFVTTGFVGDRGAKGYLVTMADLNDLQAEVDISESLLPGIALNQPATVTTDAYPGVEFHGVVTEIAPEADRAKAAVHLKVSVQKPKEDLLPDMSATVEFLRDTQSKTEQTAAATIFVPQSAIQNGVVFVDEDNKAVKRSVVLGNRIGNRVEVLQGLSAGDRLIVRASAALQDQESVKSK